MGTLIRDLFGPGTWGAGGNLVAWVLCGAIGAAAAYLLRDWAGPRLARYWHRHHGAHMRAELAGTEKRLAKRLDDHHEDLKAHVTSEISALAKTARTSARTAGTSPAAQDKTATGSGR
jgi:hypothetical protein